jgi:5'-nucleotidase
VPFAAAAAWGERVLRPLLDAPWSPRTLVNINFPPVAPGDVRGVRVVEQALRDYGRIAFDKRIDPRGFDYYWLRLGEIPHTPRHNTDMEASADGYVTVTPLHCDLTHHASITALAERYR